MRVVRFLDGSGYARYGTACSCTGDENINFERRRTGIGGRSCSDGVDDLWTSGTFVCQGIVHLENSVLVKWGSRKKKKKRRYIAVLIEDDGMWDLTCESLCDAL